LSGTPHPPTAYAPPSAQVSTVHRNSGSGAGSDGSGDPVCALHEHCNDHRNRCVAIARQYRRGTMKQFHGLLVLGTIVACSSRPDATLTSTTTQSLQPSLTGLGDDGGPISRARRAIRILKRLLTSRRWRPVTTSSGFRRHSRTACCAWPADPTRICRFRSLPRPTVAVCFSSIFSLIRRDSRQRVYNDLPGRQ